MEWTKEKPIGLTRRIHIRVVGVGSRNIGMVRINSTCDDVSVTVHIMMQQLLFFFFFRIELYSTVAYVNMKTRY